MFSPIQYAKKKIRAKKQMTALYSGKGYNTKFLVPAGRSHKKKTKCETAFQHILREAINAPSARKLATVAKIMML